MGDPVQSLSKTVHPEVAGPKLQQNPPKLLGTYECELFPTLDDIANDCYDLIVNPGSGDGYYAVGLLRLMPGARAIAYETSPRRRLLTEHVAALNGVRERLTIHGVADGRVVGHARAGEQSSSVTSREVNATCSTRRRS